MAAMATLKDDFDFGGRDSGKWQDGGANIVFSSDLRLEITSTAFVYYTMSSVDTYDLTGSYAFTQLINAGNQAIPSLECYPVHLGSGANAVSIMISGNTVFARKKVAGVSSTVGVSVAYNSTTMKWFRIRESGGTTHWEYATDPAGSWTSIASAANPITVTALNGEVVVGQWDAGAASTCIVDNFNVLPEELQFDWKGYTWNKRVHMGDPLNDQTWSTANITEPDGSDYITLSLSNAGSAPVGCEIFSEQRGFGYGTYTIVVGTRLDNIHDAAAFGGMFTFDFTDPPAYREIDMSETRNTVGGSVDADKQLLKNHVFDNGGSREFVTTNQDYTADVVQTHVARWEPGRITFDSYAGTGTGGTLLMHTVHTTNIPTPGLERVHFNVFADTGVAGYEDVTPVDVVIRDFTFTSATPVVGRTLAEVEYSAYAVKTGLTGVSLNHQKLSFYNNALSKNYLSVSEAEIAYLKAQTGLTTVNSLDHLWRSYMVGRGVTFSNSLHDMKFNFFSSYGFL